MADIAQLADEYLSWHLDNHPVIATAVGAHGHDDELGDLTAGGFEARAADRGRWIDRFRAVTDAAGDDAIDRDLVIAILRGEQLQNDEPQSWRRDPVDYLMPIFSGLHTPFLHRLRDEDEIVASTVARLRQVPDVLAACRANLDAELASPLLVRRALSQARAGRRFVTAALPAEADERHRATLADAAEPAAAAFDETVAYLEEFAERATGDWRMGETTYSALLREKELLGYGAAELHERGLTAWAELDAEMIELAATIDGTGDWRAVLDRVADDHPPTLDAMRDEYDVETQRARAFLAEHELVSFADGEECRVVPSPAFQRPVMAVAFYLQPPALTSSRVGHFFVPHTPDGASEDQVLARLRTNSRAKAPTMAVHEAYPGHHWHLSWMAGTPRRVRTVLRTSYFAEGWALYTERMMREQGYFTTPEQELTHLEARIFRAARIVVDTALHTQDMSVADAESFAATKGTLNPATAVSEVNRYCAWPTQAPSYLTGALEIESIREDWFASDRGTLREFHDTIAGSGCLPLGLARRAALGA